MFAFAPEGGLVDAQGVGRVLEVLGDGQHAADVLLFDLLERDAVADARRCRGLGKRVGQVLDADMRGGTKNSGSTTLRSSRILPGQE